MTYPWRLTPGHFSLAVGFLTWGFVAAGAGAMAIPIVIHILNRRRFKTVSWAAMEFLLRAMRKNRRRLRFEQWILLATRCALVFLLGMALARPLGCQNATLAGMGGQSGVSVIVIDNSYSMAYEANRPGGKTHLDGAKRLAKELVDRAARDGGVAIVVASVPARAIIAKPSYNPQDVKEAIDRIEQSYNATDIPGALQLALRIGQEAGGQPDKRLELLTDSTTSAWRSPDQVEALKQLGPEVARAFRVTHHSLAAGQPQDNAAVVSLRAQDNLVTSKFPADFAAGPKGFGNAADASLQWKLNDQSLGADGPVKLTADAAEVIRAGLQFPAGGPQVLSATIMGSDRLKIDDTRWRVVDVASDLKALVVEGKQGVRAGDGSGFFLREAWSPPREAGPVGVAKTVSYISAEGISSIEFANKVLDTYAAVVLADVAQITPGQAEQLERYVKRGGALFVFMGEQVNAGNYNDVLLPRKLLPGPLVKLTRVGSNEKGYLFDFDPKRMPYLRAFENQENTGLETVETFTYWQTDLSAGGNVQPILRFRSPGVTTTATAPTLPAGASTGDPALTLHALGDGRVIFCATSANQEWTTFPANLSYVTVMHELLSSAVRTGDGWLNLQVGQPLAIPAGVPLPAPPTLADPLGQPIELRATSGEAASTSAYQSDPLKRPGVYRLQIGTRQLPIAVNLPPGEADIRTIPDAGIRESLGNAELATANDELAAEKMTEESGTDLSWLFMLVVFGLLAVECVMAMRFGHYRRTPLLKESATPSAAS